MWPQLQPHLQLVRQVRDPEAPRRLDLGEGEGDHRARRRGELPDIGRLRGVLGARGRKCRRG